MLFSSTNFSASAATLFASSLAWANPWMLFGLLAGLIPIVIHLIFKRPYRDVPWGAMRFLKRALEKNVRRFPLDEWLLLLARVLALAGIALACAQPFRPSVTSTEKPARNHLIVVDTSLSMQRVVAGKSLFSIILDQARSVLNQANPGDTFQLFEVRRSSAIGIISTPSVRADLVRQELDRLQPLDSHANWPGCLATIESAIPPGGNTDVWLMTDFQRASWSGDVTSLDEVRSRIQLLSERATVHLPENLPASANSNISIDAIGVRDRWVLRGKPSSIAATVQNHGSATATGAVVWTVDGLPAGREDVRLSPHEPATVLLRWQPARVGLHRIEARLDAAGRTPDELPSDDRRRLVVNVQEEIPVLLIDGKSTDSEFGNATDFLRLALQPDDQAQGPGIRPHVLRDGSWLGEDLSRYAAVFACNVSHWNPAEATALTDLVRGGTGLVLSLGDQVQPEIWQKTLGSEPTGVGLLPARIAEAIEIPNDQFGVGFDTSRLQHPLVKIFQGVNQSGIEVVRTFRYRRLKLKDEPAPSNLSSDAEVVLWFDNGDPAIISQRFGQGRIILVATSFDRPGGTLAVFGHVLIPLVHEMLAYSAQSQLTRPEVIAGREPPMLEKVDGNEIRPLEERRWDQAGWVEHDPPNGLVAINHDPRESDLAQLTWSSLQIESHEPKPESSQDLVAIQTARPEFRWSAALLTLVLGLCLTEPWIANRSRWSWAILVVALTAATTWIVTT